jgi:iron complex transport system substrate-binding protein
MKFYQFAVTIFLVFISCSPQEQQEEVRNFVEDDLHKKVIMEKAPKRIVTLAPNLTELVFELGLGNKIIGNSTYCNYPDSAKRIENVADLLTVNLEKISALNPDLIFITTEGNSKSDYENLINLGFNVFVSNPRNFEGIKKTLNDMGKIFNAEKKANEIIQNWEMRIAEVKKTHDQVLLNSAIFLVSTNPIFSVGKKTFVHEILTFAGLKNITADSKVNYPTFNREEILIRNPDYIILYETNNNDVNDLLNAYPEWHTLSAFVNNRVFFINADLYSRPGPRFVDAVVNLNRLVLEN